MAQAKTSDVLSWPVLHYPDGSVSIEIPGYGSKRYSQEELAVACVEVLSRGDYDKTVVQRLILERLCGPVAWRQVVAAVETADELLGDMDAFLAGL